MRIRVTDLTGTEHVIEDPTVGWTVMEVIRDAGLPIKAECGGSCVCATCHVYVDEAWLARLPEKGDDETDMLDMAIDVQSNSRLSCQIEVTPELDGLAVTLSEDAVM
jgi:ferredoxin, 2Fe-2S